jgi:hypothetical protein
VLQKLINHLPTKDTADPTLKVSIPVVGSIRRVGPQKITKQLVLSVAHRPLYLVDRFQPFQMRRKPAMHAKNPPSDDSSNGQEIKSIGNYLPEANSEFSLALIIETIDFIELAALMVSA